MKDQTEKDDAAELREQFEQERIAGLKQEGKGEEVQRAMEVTLQRLRDAKPEERSELARRYAVTITEFEKVVAYFRVYVTG